MNDDTLIDVDLLFGGVQIVQTSKVENGWLWLGGYSITRDRNGKEVSRTENSWNCRVGYDEPPPRRSFISWLFRMPPPKSMEDYASALCSSHEDRSHTAGAGHGK